jgi:thiamine monophosphate synthase
LKEAVKAAKEMPLYALGGINQARAAEMAELAADSRPAGVAVIGSVFGTASPRTAAREILVALSGR